MIGGRNAFDQPVKNNIKTYDIQLVKLIYKKMIIQLVLC